MGLETTHVKLSYDLNKSIPANAQVNLDYEAFKMNLAMKATWW